MRETLSKAAAYDANDMLAPLKDEFQLPADTFYLDGNSLGPLPKRAMRAINETVNQQWGDDLISSWNKHHWIDLPISVGEKIAPLLGANKQQVVCCDSVSVNLFKVLSCALKLNPDRNVILSQSNNFPTDLYMVDGLQKLLGESRCHLKLSDSENVEDDFDDDVSVLLMTQVDFRSGMLADIESITLKAHGKGIIVIWDLSHSTGVIPLELDSWNVDFAVGCGYKFLNGGPGAPAFIYAASKHHLAIEQPLQGWMGHKAPFEFSKDYQASFGVSAFLCGTPPILSMSALSAALDLFADIPASIIREKSIKLAEFFRGLVTESVVLSQLELRSPENYEIRGAQLAYSHSHAYEICQALAAEQVVADFRSPTYLRFGFSPLFLSFTDIAKSIAILEKVVSEKVYLDPKYAIRQSVT